MTSQEPQLPSSESPPSVARLLENPRAWCVGAWARTCNHKPTRVFASDASQWSVIGAIHHEYPQRDKRLEIRFDVAFAIKRMDLIPSYPWEKHPIGSLHSATQVILYWERMHALHTELMEIVYELGI